MTQLDNSLKTLQREVAGPTLSRRLEQRLELVRTARALAQRVKRAGPAGRDTTQYGRNRCCTRSFIRTRTGSSGGRADGHGGKPPEPQRRQHGPGCRSKMF